MRTLFVAELYQILRGNTYGEGACFMGSAMHPPQGGGITLLSNFGVPFYLCLHPLMQNYKFGMVTHGERRMVLDIR